MKLLDIENLNLGFYCENGFKQALFDVTFSLNKGEMLALVGESGCGKTISAMSILQLLPKNAGITSGVITFENQDLLKLSCKELQHIRGSKIALIPQDPMTSLNPLFTVGDQLLEVLKIHQNLKGKEAVDKLLKEKRGHVKNAFFRQEVGGIDLVWGNEKGGLCHTIQKRDALLQKGKGKISGIEMVKKIPEILQKGEFSQDNKGRFNIEHGEYRVGILPTYYDKKINWVVTAMELWK